MALIPKPRIARPNNAPVPAAPSVRPVAELEPERGYLSREVAELATVNELTGEESVVVWDNGRTWKSPLRYIINLARTENVPAATARMAGGGGRHTYERSVARAPASTAAAGDLFLAVRDGESIQLDVGDISGGGSADADTLDGQLPAYYLARANHTGTQLASTISDFSEAVDDRAAALIQNGTGITWTYSDAGGTLTPAISLASFSTADLSENSNLYFTDERAQDAVGAALTDSSTIDFTYTDASNTITAVVIDGGITLAKMANMATASLIYRRTAGTGVPEVNTLSQLKTDLTLVKGDVGLGNVDNTSDATKNAASAALTNKDLTSGTNTFPTFNQSTTGSAATLTTARTIDGQSFNGSANITVIAPGTHAASSKATPVDADEVPLVDSAASNVLKRLTWANLKATLKTYFDTLYETIGPSWTAFIPTPTSGSGSFTSASAAGRYLVRGKSVSFTVTVTITTNGTAGTSVICPLPTGTAVAATAYNGYSNAEITMQAHTDAGGSVIFIRSYDTTYPGASGRSITVSGKYEVP